MYESPYLTKFYRFVTSKELRYGIVSDKYGLHLDNEKLRFYDLHPSELSESRKCELGKIIGLKTRECGFDSLVFYNTSPIRSVPYFKMLANSGLHVYYTTKIDL